MIHELLDEVEASAASKLYRVALLAALTVPDIAGALDSADGRASQQRYERWFDKYVAPKYVAFGTQYLTGHDCYQYRCVLLHQARMLHPASRYKRSVFLFAKEENIAYCGAFLLDGGATLAIDVSVFCRNLVAAAQTWLDEVENSALFQANSTHSLELFELSFGS